MLSAIGRDNFCKLFLQEPNALIVSFILIQNQMEVDVNKTLVTRLRLFYQLVHAQNVFTHTLTQSKRTV